MGDRCYVSLGCLAKDAKVFADELGMHIEEQEHLLVNMVSEEVNYGGYDELEGIAARGIAFRGFSGAGGAYGPALFVGIAEQFSHVETPHEQSAPIITVRSNGKIDRRQYKEALRYWRLDRAYDLYIEKIAGVGFDLLMTANVYHFINEFEPEYSSPQTCAPHMSAAQYGHYLRTVFGPPEDLYQKGALLSGNVGAAD